MLTSDTLPYPAENVLTVEEFASRLKVFRATVFSWMKKEILVQGRHYFKIGRVLRFIGGNDLVENLLEDFQGMGKPRRPKHSKILKQQKESPINWDY